MAFARTPSVTLDCPDPTALATFYGRMLGWEVVDATPDWADLRGDSGIYLSFQRVDPFTAPDWPGQGVPQQMHVDVVVDDLDAGEQEAIALGAVKHDYQPGQDFRVFLDPAGHPFCLCLT